MMWQTIYRLKTIRNMTHHQDMEQDTLYKSRSAKACMVAAYHLYNDHFKTIFKTLWMPVSLYALLVALTSACVTWWQKELSGDGSIISVAGLTSLLLMLLTVLTSLFMQARILSFLNKKTRRWNLKRCVRLMAYTFILALPTGALCFAAAWGASLLLKDSGFQLLAPLLFLVMTWLIAVFWVYPSMRYLMEDDNAFWKQLPVSFKRGCRYSGLIYSTVFLSSIILSVLSAIPLLPTIIVNMAQWSSHNGIITGDPAGMNASFPVFYIIAHILSAFVLTFLSFWALFTHYYLYGAIEGNEQERNDRKPFVSETNKDELSTR